jgi:hypothetical protein
VKFIEYHVTFVEADRSIWMCGCVNEWLDGCSHCFGQYLLFRLLLVHLAPHS